METWQIGAIVLGVSALVVFLTSLLKTVNMGDRLKNFLALAVSAVAGVVTDLSTKNWDLSAYANLDILATVLVIYGAANLIYQFIIKNTVIDAKLESLTLGHRDEGEGF
jgi:hypothetical protein